MPVIHYNSVKGAKDCLILSIFGHDMYFWKLGKKYLDNCYWYKFGIDLKLTSQGIKNVCISVYFDIYRA